MNKIIQIQEAIQYLYNWQSKIRLNNCIFFYDINKASEGVALMVLSCIYKLNKLQDLNDIKANFPGIDLGDLEKGICFQVSSSFTTSKIRETLKTYLSNQNIDNKRRNISNKFPTLKFFFITDEEELFSNVEKKNILEIDNNFNFSEQIITLKDIIKEINILYDKDRPLFDKLHDYLKKEFGPLKSENKVQNFFFFNITNRDEINSFDLDETISRYLESRKNKYIFAKTFIHRQEVYFYDFYTPLSIESDKNKLLISSAENLFKNTKKNFISIIGNAGSGKSTLVKFLFLNAIETYYAIPILIELRRLSEYPKSFLDYLNETIFFNKINNVTANDLYNSGKLLFIFDGFDEIDSEHRSRILQEIERFTDCFNSNKFIITSRPGVNIESFQRYKNYRVSPLKNDELEKFIEKQIIIYPEEEDSIKREKSELRKRIITKIKSEYNNIFKDYLTNPLLLSMFILTFEQYPDIPNSKSKFYSNVFETLYQKHDAFTKNSWVRPKLSGLEQNEYESVLEKFSFKAFKESKVNFSKKYFYTIIDELKKSNIIGKIDNNNLLNDFNVAIPIFKEDGFEEYCFAHKSLMEYFAANAIHNSHYQNKLKLYTNFVKERMQRSSHDNNLNSICYELDNIIFKELVILPLLYQVKDILLKKEEIIDDKVIFKNYLNIVKTAFVWIDKNKIVLIRNQFTVINSIYEVINRHDPSQGFYRQFFPLDKKIEFLSSKYKDKITFTNSKKKIYDGENILYLYDIDIEDLINIYEVKNKPYSTPIEPIKKLYEDIIFLIDEFENQIKENQKNEMNFFEL